MDVRDLEGFVALAEVLNFSKAAARVNMSQSAMTRLVRRLETEIGVTLFDRSTHSVTLTYAGAAFLPEVRAVMAKVEEAVRAARRPEHLEEPPTVRPSKAARPPRNGALRSRSTCSR